MGKWEAWLGNKNTNSSWMENNILEVTTFLDNARTSSNFHIFHGAFQNTLTNCCSSHANVLTQVVQCLRIVLINLRLQISPEIEIRDREVRGTRRPVNLPFLWNQSSRKELLQNGKCFNHSVACGSFDGRTEMKFEKIQFQLIFIFHWLSKFCWRKAPFENL